jgi:hypothetical protein
MMAMKQRDSSTYEINLICTYLVMCHGMTVGRELTGREG